MLDLSDTNAWHVVHFDPPATGAQIVAAAKATTERSGDVHHEEAAYYNGWVVEVGRASEHLERGVVVAQDLARPYLDPEESYDSVVLAHHHLWDAGSTIRPANANIQNVVGSLKEFGADLQRHVGSGADQNLGQNQERTVQPVVLSETATRQAVQFERPTTGRELITSIKACCVPESMYGTQYYEAANPDGSQIVAGQSSGLAHKSLVVIPIGGEGYIDPDATYTGAIVANHHLAVPWQHRFPVRSTVEDEFQSVGEFAARLDRSVRQQNLASLALDRSPARGSGPDRSGSNDPELGAFDRPQRTPGTRLGDNLSRG
ncbi:hypothetical protein [Kribbella sp. NPDC004875]|uniref:hypothetical protein n=1 Tax=Kribbella sp. NPDC004875 TaxID=3364107 RepID=UPI0036762824